MGEAYDRKHCHLLIEPIRTPIAYHGNHPFGTPEQLPAIVCVARVTVPQPARDKTRDGSALTIIWFQEQCAFPIAEHVLKSITEIPWSQLKEDFDY
jgi:hypothetical protein